MIDDENKLHDTPENANEGSDEESLIKQDTSKEIKETIAKTPIELANEARDILYEAFGKDFNLTKEDGIRKYHIAKKDHIIQLKGSLVPVEGKVVLGEGQMIMEVNSRGKLKIRLNTDDGIIYYRAVDISNEDLLAEIPAIKTFINDNAALPSTSRFTKEEPFTGMQKKDIDKKISQRPDVSQEIVEEASTGKYFSIPSLSEEKKQGLKLGESIDGRIKEKVPSYLNGNLGDFVVIKKLIPGETEGAYVREYVDGMPEHLKGVQFFNEKAAKNLGVYVQLPKDEDIPQEEDQTPESVLKFIQENGLQKTGKHDAKHNEFVSVGDKHIFMLQDGKFAEIDLRRGYYIDVIGGMDKEYGYPIILKKK